MRFAVLRACVGFALLACSALLVHYTVTDDGIFLSHKPSIRSGYWFAAGAAAGAGIAVAILPRRWQVSAVIVILGALAGFIACSLFPFPVWRK
jgi:hypothetical protein